LTDLNPQAKQMADESMVRNLDAQARAIWPQELSYSPLCTPSEARYSMPLRPGEIASRLADLFSTIPRARVDIIDTT